ncbi:MAG: sialate O-acetylesterase [Oscillospiraceae bacterium]|nr:sialate O-acetylesterase [Oscillospiraceae bacterium]
MSCFDLAAVFTDHMVLQRNKNINIWGCAYTATDITVELCGKSVTTRAESGKWKAVLPPMEAGGPYELKVTDNRGGETVLHDVMIGEVWFAGGQSNMELELQNALNGNEVLKNIKDVNVRFYYTQKIAYIDDYFHFAERNSCWTVAAPDTAANYSAVGYYFARRLAAALGVTVGVIGCNWGGTSASSWMSRKALEQDADTRSYVDEYDKTMEEKTMEGYLKELAEYEEWHNEWQPKINEYYATAENPTWEGAQEYAGPSRWPEPMGPRSQFRPGGLYETMVTRICPYTLAGFIYYQGESDDHKPDTYYKLFKALIEQWRTDWEDDSLPFVFVQLPMFMNEGDEDFKHWCKIREAQMRVHRTTANTGIAVILDKGEFNNIHPIDKEPVGERLALQALYHVYGKISADEAYGAIYKSHEYTDGGITLSFDHAGDGFELKGEKAVGFEVAGKDKKYHTADAWFKEDKIFVRSAEVAEPVYLRYNWTNYGDVTVYSKNGIPLAPFRTSRNDE